jgi:hypothetical protein
MRHFPVVIAFLLGSWCACTKTVRNPEHSNPEHKSVLEALRPGVETDLGQKVEFVVSILHISGDWAFMYGFVQQPGGKPLDLQKLKHPGLVSNRDEEMWENNVQALLHRKNGTWALVEQAINCTDICWLEWASREDLPKDLIPN